MSSVTSHLGLSSPGSNGLPDPDELGGQFGGSGSNAGIFGLGQFHTDPYKVNSAAFGPNSDEQAYIKQLQGYANGQNPSAAQIQMQRGLEQANANANATAASARGISPALAARYAAMQQSQNNQNINGQMAALRAQEQQGYMGMLGNELQNVRSGQMGLENLNSGNFNYAAGLNLQGYNAAAGNRMKQWQQIGNAMSLGGSGGGGAGGGGGGGGPMSMAGGAGDAGGMSSMMAFAANGGEIPDPSSFNTTPPLPQAQGSTAPDPGSGSTGMAGTAKSMVGLLALLNKGGEVEHGGPQSETGKFLCQALGQGKMEYMSSGGMSGFGGMFGQGGNPMAQAAGGLNVPQNQSSQINNKPPIQAQFEQNLQAKPAIGATYNPQMAAHSIVGVNPQVVHHNPYGAMFGGGFDGGLPFFKQGGTVPGKAPVKGDSIQNDKVPTMLSPGEIVIPRSITQSDDAGAKAKAFVDKIKASHKKGK